MKIGKVHSNIFLIAFFCVATMLAQPPASSGNQELDKLLSQGLGQVYGDPKISFVLQNAKPGDASSGVVIARTSDAVYIDPAPCSTGRSKRIVAFSRRFKESKVSDAVCNGRSYPKIQVIQE